MDNAIQNTKEKYVLVYLYENEVSPQAAESVAACDHTYEDLC